MHLLSDAHWAEFLGSPSLVRLTVVLGEDGRLA